MKISRLLATSAQEANYLAVIALFGLVVKTLILNRWPAIFPGAFELGQIIEAILASILASYVFYFLVVHLTSFKDRERVEPFVKQHLVQIIRSAQDLLAQISKVAGVAIKLDNFTEEALVTALSQMRIHRDGPIVLLPDMRKGTWLDYCQHGVNKSKASASKIFRQITLVSAERVELLAAIDDCEYFRQIELLRRDRVNLDHDLAFTARTLVEYFGLCEKLRLLEKIGHGWKVSF